MSEFRAIVLASCKAGLAAEVSDLLPNIMVLAAEDQLPLVPPAARTWCFVDWVLPNLSGLAMCRRLRNSAATADSHITMVLDEDDAEAKRRALRAGADDYVIGPLTAELLLDRLQRGHRTTIAHAEPPRLSYGDLVLEPAAHQVRWQGHVVPMRPNEYRLLGHFLKHPDQVFSRSDLITALGKSDPHIDERTVDVWVGRLRRGLKSSGAPDPLRTVRSAGYVLDSFMAERAGR